MERGPGSHAQDEEFRAEVRAWLDDNLTGEFAALRGTGGPGREHEAYDERLAWDRHLAAARLDLHRLARRARRPRRRRCPSR